MFKYQSLDISDFSGGLTDNYKTSSKAKFNVLKNFINSDNRSIRVRDGVAPLSEVGTSPIRDISVLGNKTIFQAGTGLASREDTDVTTIAELFPSGSNVVTSADRWRNSMLYTVEIGRAHV